MTDERTMRKADKLFGKMTQEEQLALFEKYGITEEPVANEPTVEEVTPTTTEKEVVETITEEVKSQENTEQPQTEVVETKKEEVVKEETKPTTTTETPKVDENMLLSALEKMFGKETIEAMKNFKVNQVEIANQTPPPVTSGTTQVPVTKGADYSVESLAERVNKNLGRYS